MLIGRAQKQKKAAHGDLLLCDPDALRGNYMARQPQGLFSNAIRHNMKGAQGYAVPHGWVMSPSCQSAFGIVWNQKQKTPPVGRVQWLSGCAK